MKISILLVLLFFVFVSCDHDYFPDEYDYPPSASYQFTVKGHVHDSDSSFTLSNIMVMMKPESLKDTLTEYTDSTGTFSFLFNRNYGSSALFMLRDTSGYYNDFDTMILFSGRDFNAGLREIYVNL